MLLTAYLTGTWKKLKKALSGHWGRLYEPQVISAFYGLWWTVTGVLGGYSTLHPPRTIENVAGDVLMIIITLLLVVGSAIGVFSVARGAYWSERTAVAFVSLGGLGYLAMSAYLWASSEGNRGMSVWAIIAAVALTLLRLHWVNKRPYAEGTHTSNISIVTEGPGGSEHTS